MLEDDRWQAAGGSGRCVAPAVSVGYRELEAGTRSPSFETRNGICKLCGWKQTFTTSTRH